jgi:hypothetical protein
MVVTDATQPRAPNELKSRPTTYLCRIPYMYHVMSRKGIGWHAALIAWRQGWSLGSLPAAGEDVRDVEDDVHS